MMLVPCNFVLIYSIGKKPYKLKFLWRVSYCLVLSAELLYYLSDYSQGFKQSTHKQLVRINELAKIYKATVKEDML